MPNTREKLIDVFMHIGDHITNRDEYGICFDTTLAKGIEDVLQMLKNGVTVQDDVTELIGRGLDNIYWKMYGANKEFNERMAGYNPSAFCAGFEYAIQLAKGLLTQLPQPPKGE